MALCLGSQSALLPHDLTESLQIAHEAGSRTYFSDKESEVARRGPQEAELAGPTSRDPRPRSFSSHPHRFLTKMHSVQGQNHMDPGPSRMTEPSLVAGGRGGGGKRRLRTPYYLNVKKKKKKKSKCVSFCYVLDPMVQSPKQTPCLRARVILAPFLKHGPGTAVAASLSHAGLPGE